MKMDYNINISKMVLIDEVLDVDNLILKLTEKESENASIIFMSLTPYFALVADGLINLFSKTENVDEDHDRFNKINFTHRNTLKILTDKSVAKAEDTIKIYSNHLRKDLMKDYNFLQKTFIKIFGQEDLGTYSINGDTFANTTLYLIYFYSFYSSNKSDKHGEVAYRSELSNYSKNLSSLIHSYATIFKGSNGYNLGFNRQEFDLDVIEMNDFYLLDKKRRNIFKNHNNINLALMLFNIKCVLTFSQNVLPSLMDFNSSLLLRIQMINYYQMIRTLNKIQNKYDILIGESLSKFTNINRRCELYFKNNLRGNIFHYKIVTNNTLEYSNSKGMDLFKSMIEIEASARIDVIISEISEDINTMLDIVESILSKGI